MWPLRRVAAPYPAQPLPRCAALRCELRDVLLKAQGTPWFSLTHSYAIFGMRRRRGRAGPLESCLARGPWPVARGPWRVARGPAGTLQCSFLSPAKSQGSKERHSRFKIRKKQCGNYLVAREIMYVFEKTDRISSRKSDWFDCNFLAYQKKEILGLSY